MSKKTLVGGSLLALAAVSLVTIFALEASRPHTEIASATPQAAPVLAAISPASSIPTAPSPTVLSTRAVQSKVHEPIAIEPTTHTNDPASNSVAANVAQDIRAPSVATVATVNPVPALTVLQAPRVVSPQSAVAVSQQAHLVQKPTIAAITATVQAQQKEVAAPPPATQPKRDVETLTVTAPRVQQVARVDIDTIGRGNSLTILLPRKNSRRD
jgi:hypothetical protein